MAMDPTASRNNARMSIKKFLIDNIETAQSKKIFFDFGYSLPNEENKDLTQWFSVKIGAMKRGGLSDFITEIICATRQDLDGDLLGEMSDIVFDLMTDKDQPDGKRRIDFYDVSDDPWVSIGTLLVDSVIDSEDMSGPDNTKYQVLTCKIIWVAKA
ncbi:MAG: hypothetical protein PVI54_20935 [Desulfobacteraceae bacterium]|jgi:hypothetical protein